VVTASASAATTTASAAPTRQGARVAHGQIVVHNDSHTSHVIPSLAGDPNGVITPAGKVAGDFTSDGGELGLAGIEAHGTFFPTADPSNIGNLAHTTDYAFAVRFDR